MGKHIHQKPNLSPEERQRQKELRERFQRERPSMDDLLASEEYVGPISQGAYLEILALLSQLRRHRESAGLSLTDLANRTGMDKATLSRLETGQQGNPTLETILRYIRALGKRIVWQLEDAPGEAEGTVCQQR